MRDRSAPDAVGVDAVDDADVGKLRHDPVGQMLQRRARVERAREQAPGLGEDLERAP